MPRTIRRYEQQQEPEARFVKAVDKFMPRLIHMGDWCKGLHEIGMSNAELAASMDWTAASVATYAGEFPELLALGEELSRRTLAVHAQGAGPGG
jgi:hypothetical protein